MSGNKLIFNKNGYKSDSKRDVNYIVIDTDYKYKFKILWLELIYMSTIHILALYGMYLLVFGKVSWKLYACHHLYQYAGAFSITMGAHRLFSHRSFEAHPALRFLLIMINVTTGQRSLFTWVRDHRLHHRYSDTDADPHNAKRGFFFSHIGWTVLNRHPLVVEHSRKVDMSDMEADWMVMFQKRYYVILYFIFVIILPTWFGVYFFNETYLNAFSLNMLRYAFLFNITSLINSAAHSYGTRPYEKNIQPVDNWFASFMSYGEGWHNYHHTYPWDYKAAELPYFINVTTVLIDMLATTGLVRNRKCVDSDAIKNRIKQAGDGTHFVHGYEEAKRQVTAIGPVHPFNPSYSVTYEPPNISAKIFDYKH